jgi:hypothetical protein
VIHKPARLSGSEVRYLRKYLGWSGADFAGHVGVDPSTVSNWETDKERRSSSRAKSRHATSPCRRRRTRTSRPQDPTRSTRRCAFLVWRDRSGSALLRFLCSPGAAVLKFERLLLLRAHHDAPGRGAHKPRTSIASSRRHLGGLHRGGRITTPKKGVPSRSAHARRPLDGSRARGRRQLALVP